MHEFIVFIISILTCFVKYLLKFRTLLFLDFSRIQFSISLSFFSLIVLYLDSYITNFKTVFLIN